MKYPDRAPDSVIMAMLLGLLFLGFMAGGAVFRRPFENQGAIMVARGEIVVDTLSNGDLHATRISR